jgi:hypothetical protein
MTADSFISSALGWADGWVGEWVDGLVDASAARRASVWRELVTATCAPRREITSRRPALRHADLFSYFKLGLHAASANAPEYERRNFVY